MRYPLTLAWLAPLALAAAGPTLDPALAGVAGEADVIIVYDNDDDASRGRREDAIRRHGGKNHKHRGSVGMGSLRASRALLDEIKRDPKVRSISLDRRVSVSASKSYDPDEVRAALGLSDKSRGTHPGKGIGVAVIDSGVAALDALRGGSKCTTSRIVYSQNFATDFGTTDAFGHGTHVASILGADNNCDSTSYMGAAPEVNIVNLRALDASGTGSDSTVIAAIDRAIALKSTYNIRVMNLSLGRSVSQSYVDDPLCQAAERAWKAGIVVVAAAGNLGRYAATQGYGTIAAPGNDPYVITVGATRNPQWGSDSRTDDTLASYSSKGPSAINRVVKPDLVAPGNMMYARIANPSTLLTQLPGNARVMDGKQYLRLSGTSMATPVVSAVAAMMIQKDPSLTPDQVKARLMKTAWKGMLPTASVYDSATATTYHIQHDLFAIGAGYLDASAALASTEKIGATKSAMSPYAKVRTDGKVEIRTDYPGTTNIVWGETSVWATNIVWGTNVLLANNLVWGENIVWGSNVAAGYNIIWGAGGVTGSSNPFMLALNAVGDN